MLTSSLFPPAPGAPIPHTLRPDVATGGDTAAVEVSPQMAAALIRMCERENWLADLCELLNVYDADYPASEYLGRLTQSAALRLIQQRYGHEHYAPLPPRRVNH